MSRSESNIDNLIIKYLQQVLTEQETAQLNEWIAASDKNRRLFEKLAGEKWIFPELQKLYDYDEEKGWQKIKEEFPFTTPARQVLVKKIAWWRVAAAAAVVIIVLTGSYFLFFGRKPSKKEQAGIAGINKDIPAPQTNRATIQLADGRTVYLDSVANGELTWQGNIKLVKLGNGQIAYETMTGEVLREMKYNTLTNPRGSKVIDLALSDGSHVWLNAGSSVTYPVAFVGNERKVSMTGEAYFEVAHDATKPFYVSKGDMSVQVLGTRFNVNTYEDEDAVRVTLLEGSVRTTVGSFAPLMLKPGGQAVIRAGGVTLETGANLQQVMAWKDGLFSFDDAGIQAVMRELSRWYDLDVSYEGKIPAVRFSGEISRSQSFAGIMKVLGQLQVRYRIGGERHITIMP